MISKRLRYEVLRRDDHTCRYCGSKAPDVKLQIDHVLPVTLGGSDKPENLVTACAACNGGKSSVPPDAPLVEDVAHDALRWRKAMEQAAIIQTKHMERRDEYLDEFFLAWTKWKHTAADGERYPIALPDDWTQSVSRFFDLGLAIDQLTEAVDTAMRNERVTEMFRYMCGICWNVLEERQSIARDLLAGERG